MRIVYAIFLAAHGLVHLIWVGQALRYYEIEPGFSWPDGAWAFGWLPGDSPVRWIAAVALGFVGAAFIVAGIALAFKLAWWQPAALVGAAVSTAALVLLWNGRMEGLDKQGIVAIALNIAIIVAMLGFHWPSLDA